MKLVYVCFVICVCFFSSFVESYVPCSWYYSCPDYFTCCMGVRGWGCCPGVGAICCADGVSCCPPRTICDLRTRSCRPKNKFIFMNSTERTNTTNNFLSTSQNFKYFFKKIGKIVAEILEQRESALISNYTKFNESETIQMIGEYNDTMKLSK